MARPARFTEARAIDLAVDIIDRSGLAAFSMERLARGLGVTGPALYHHFRGRDAVLTAVAENIIGRFTPVAFPEHSMEDWRTALVAYACDFRRSIARYPELAPLLLTHLPPRTLLPAYERIFAFLGRSGIPASQHVLIVEGIEKLTLGTAPWISRVLAQEPEPARFAAAAAAAKCADDEEARFVATVTAFVNGVAAGDTGAITRPDAAPAPAAGR